MAGQQIKSASITNLDLLDASGSPILANSAGYGAPGKLVEQSDFCTTTLAGLVSTLSTYNTVRVPWTAKIKSMELSADAALDTSTGLVVDVGAYYTDSLVEGLINPALSGTSVGSAVNQFAAASTILQSSAKGPVSCLIPGTFTTLMKNEELWLALGLSKNPGGFCDIVVAVHTAATSGGTGGALGLQVRYVE